MLVKLILAPFTLAVQWKSNKLFALKNIHFWSNQALLEN